MRKIWRVVAILKMKEPPGDEGIPNWYPTRKQGPQNYSHKWLDAVNNLNELEGRFFPRPPGKSQEFVLFLQPHFSPVLPTTKHMFHPCAIIGFDLGLSYSKPLHMLFPLLGMLVPTSAFSIDCVTEISLSGPSLDFTCYDNLFLTPFSICLT